MKHVLSSDNLLVKPAFKPLRADTRALDVLSKVRFDPDAARKEIEGRIGDLLSEKDGVERLLAALKDMYDERSQIKMEKPSGSKLHHYTEDVKKKRAVGFASDTNSIGVKLGSIYGGRMNMGAAVSIVVEHDWAAAFSSSEEISDGEYQLPFEHTIFEFKAGGHHVILYAHEELRILSIEDQHGWLVVDGWEDFVYAFTEGFIEKQIKAISVALEADVATTDLVRAPEKLNASRVKSGKYPLSDYRIVRLDRRKRYAALSSSGGQKHKSPRLHFVRGHWRKYAEHKTWVKWHLRGDIDLGFIDKHYRL